MQITRGKRARAQRVIIYGPEGIGKSSFAAQFPEPLFIDTEGSTDNMDVARLDKPTSWTMLRNQIAFIKANPTVCKTLVIDTVDWAESLAIDHICSESGKKGIEDFGYGAGYIYLLEEMGRFLNLLQDLIELGINVVMTAHSQVRKFTKPDEMGGYDRYELKLSNKKTEANVSAKVKEWADMVLFIDYKTYVVTDEKTKKQKAQGGQRVIYTTHSPSWDAKNRHGLDDELPLDYNAIAHIFNQTNSIQSTPTQTTTTPTQQVEAQTVEQSTITQQIPTQVTPEQSQQKIQSVDYGNLPQALVDLMTPEQVTPSELVEVAYIRGHWPMGTPIENFTPEYWNMIVAHWQDTLTIIREKIRKEPDYPFQT